MEVQNLPIYSKGLYMEKVDLLGRNDFIEMLEKIVSNKVDKLEGLSLAIDGRWGCGKSFIIRELEKKLIGQGCLVVHYNCWQNDYYDEPLVAILSVLVDSLNELQTPEAVKAEKTKVTKDAIILFFKRIAFMILKNKFGVDVEELGFNINELKDSVQEVLGKDKADLICKDFDKNLSLKKTIGIVCEFLLKLKEEYRGIVFVVDELDRCLPEYSIKVLERLHHICYDTANDTFQFAQIIAINREELCDGISKAYGRGLLKGVEGSEKTFTKSGSSSFGNYYLQKFIQMIVPVPVAKPSDSMISLLKGFEACFEMQNPSFVPFVDDMLKKAFRTVSMRIKEETIEFVQMAHQVTLDRCSEEKLGKVKPSFLVFCVEFIDCFCRVILKSELPTLQIRTVNRFKKDPFETSDDEISLDIFCRAEFVADANMFRNDCFDFFKCNCYPNTRSSRMHRGVDQHFTTIRSSSLCAQILYHYNSEKKDYEFESGSGVLGSDVKFIEEFRKTLDILVPMQG